MSDDLFPPLYRPLGDGDALDVLASAIRAGAAGGLSRNADLFLASVSAEIIADRLALAGVVLMRRHAKDGPGF